MSEIVDNQSNLESTKAKSPLSLLTLFHLSATTGNKLSYFGSFAVNGVFLGTDPHERWIASQFLLEYGSLFTNSSPAWTYTLSPNSRNIEIHHETFATFSELLVAQDFGKVLAKGSGCLVKKGEFWFILQYNLSFSVPNELCESLLPAIADFQQKV